MLSALASPDDDDVHPGLEHEQCYFPDDWPNEFGAMVSMHPDIADRVAERALDGEKADEGDDEDEDTESQAEAPDEDEVGGELLDSLSDRLASPAEEKLLARLRRELARDLEAAPPFPELTGETRLLRTLRSNDHRVPVAAEAFRKHLAVRQEYGLDAARQHIVENFENRLWELRAEELPHGEAICSFLPEVLVFSRARNGNPIGLACWGKHKPKAFVQVDGWQHKYRVYSAHLCEWRALLLDRSSKEQERLVHFVNIVELQDWSMLGNSDSDFTAYQQTLSQLSQTYHDFNTRFFFIRTSIWAKGAYNMFFPLIPEKVRNKTFFFGDDFLEVQELQRALDASALDALQRREFGDFDPSRRRVQEGCVTISANDVFELAVEIPANATLYWDFDVEGGELAFSLVRPGADASMPIENWEPLHVSGEGISGMLRKAGEVFCYPSGEEAGGPRRLILRWDNCGAWWWSRTVRYRVQVVPPPDAEPNGKDRSLQPCLRVLATSAVVVLLASGVKVLRPEWNLL